MKNAQVILPIVCCVSVLSGCAYFKSSSSEGWTRKPTVTVAQSGDGAQAMYKLGRYYQGQQRYEQAIVAYRKALAADNSFADAHNGLGVVYWQQGKTAESLEEFRNAVKKAPGAARFHNNLGYAYFTQGRYADSIASLKESILLEPDNVRTRDNLNQAYAKSGIKSESSIVRVNGQDDGVPDLVVPLVESPIIAVKVANNIYEIRERPQVMPDNPAATIQVAHESASDTDRSAAKEEKIHVEVSNGNGVSGMAKMVGRYLLKKGYSASRITNQKSFEIKTTQIQYREGYLEQAKSLQSHFSEKPQLIQRNGIRANVAVRLVLGRDMVGRIALYDDNLKMPPLAINELGY